MGIAINIVGFSVFGVWFYILISSIKKMREVRQVKGLEECYNYYSVKSLTKDSENPEYQKLFHDLKKFRRRTFQIWFSSLGLSVIILMTIGVITAK